MNIINSELLDILSKKYALSTPIQCDEFFTQYLVTNKRKKAYLFLVNDYNISYRYLLEDKNIVINYFTEIKHNYLAFFG